MKRLLPLALLLTFANSLPAQDVVRGNEQATAAAENERKIMEATLNEVLELVGRDTPRGEKFMQAQNEWVTYVKTQAEADADGVSGQARYPQSYFETMRELTRYRTRTLEGCLSRLRAEGDGGRVDLATASGTGQEGGQAKARDWKAEVGDSAVAAATELFSASMEGVDGIVIGQWRGDDQSLWRGVFFADRGDTMVLYGGKMERGGVVFEAWQENARIGRGYVRQEDENDPTWRGRFFDERRRESPVILNPVSPAKPVGYQVAVTPYTGLVNDEEVELGLAWHDSRYVAGEYRGNELRGHNYDSGKVYLEEWEPGETGRLVAMWSLEKESRRGNVRWSGLRRTMDGEVEEVDFGR